MKSDMNIPPIPPAASNPVRPGAAGGEVLKLLQPLEGLISPGQSAQAQVLSLKQGDAVFQLLLKLTLDSGRQTNVQVSSNQPLPLGTLLSVTQPSPASLAVSLQQALSSNASALTRLDPQQLPVGTLVQGKVLSTQVLAQAAGQPAVYRSLVTLLNSALSGSTLTVDSPRPLRVDSLLTASARQPEPELRAPERPTRPTGDYPATGRPAKPPGLARRLVERPAETATQREHARRFARLYR